MDKLDWQGYVQKVASCDVPIPLTMINDFEDWKCRSIVGRMLLILKDMEGAMEVLATVKDVQPDMNDAPEYGLSEAEHKVLCLRDIAEIVWQLTGTGDAPVFYLKQAYKLCRDYEHIFRSADRGKIWVRALEIMRSCGEEEKALVQAHAMLEAEKATPGINPYRFHALKFIAESMAAQGDYNKGSILITEAYQSFPVTEAAERDLAEAAALADAKERYEAYHHCTTIQYQPWERGNIPTLDDVRRLQEENMRKREAAKAQGAEGVANLINQLK
ncbi:hypothetical protein [Phascolarctobacterium sp.]|uniref:hypothetical protein n=1 Tax=Phascolarctobacterium sp. TaxID=2049039 RepID=UPI00386F1290